MINKIISPVAFHMDLPLSYRWLHPVFHASQLKPHIGQVPDTEYPVVLGDDDIESQYEVDQVLDVQNKKLGQITTRQILIVWKEYPLAEAIWEPEQRLANAPEVLAKFWSRTLRTE